MVDRLDPRRPVSVCAAINPPSPLARAESRARWSSAVYHGDLIRRLSLSTRPWDLLPIYSSILEIDASLSFVQLSPLASTLHAHRSTLTMSSASEFMQALGEFLLRRRRRRTHPCY